MIDPALSSPYGAQQVAGNMKFAPVEKGGVS